MYATKRRRRNVKNYKHPPKETQKSNPSKRHRERLNAELENLASLLPFEQNILTKLDKLSILRLAVSFLRIKSYFQANLKSSMILQQSIQQQENERARLSHIQYQDSSFSEGNAIFESLNGFILIVNENSEVFYSSRTVEQFIGFHQSDIIHQSVFELIHSEDREEFKKHLQWNSMLPADKQHLTLNEVLSNKDYAKYLERNFTVRFRCLLDNTSGFLTLDIVGRLSVLHGQRGAFQLDSNGEIINPSVKSYGKGKSSKLTNNNLASNPDNSPNSSNMAFNQSLNEKSEPILALFGIACPFGPSSIFELPQRDSLFKTKHKVNLSPVSLDSKGKLLLGYSDAEFSQFGAYDLIHSDDLKYYASAHKELLKTGSSGLICYRIQTAKNTWQWLQTSMRTIYKSNKPECTLANHRPLTDEEGEELFYKRGFEFKLPYPYFYDFETNSFTNSTSNSSASLTPQSYTDSNTLPSSSSASGALSSSLNPLSSLLASSEEPIPVSIQKKSSSSSSSSSSQSTKSQSKISKGVHKTKVTKQSTKSQLIQQRAQQHAQQQLQLQQQQQQQQQQHGQYSISEHSQAYYTSYTNKNINSENMNDYYHIKTETDTTADNSSPSGYTDSTKLMNPHINQISDYSTLSSSSTSSCSSSVLGGSNSVDGISVSISSQACHPYYFSHQQAYGDYSAETSKFYSGAASSYAPSNGGFYNQPYNYTNQYNHFNASQTPQSIDTTSSLGHVNNILSQNSHSNNSSCSSTSSSASSTSSIVNTSYGNGAENSGRWGQDQMDTTVTPAPTSLYGSTHDAYAGMVPHQGHHHQGYDLIANNAAVIAAASYSCASAAAASPYGAYPFAVDDYKPAISQIPL